MASWTDQPTQFIPYVQQLPVEAMLAVGVEKQRRYDEGIRKIQSAIDRVAGLDIARDVDKKYLQSKLNDLGTRLRTVAAGDFSNYQLTNHVAGMASSVGKDENIIGAVASTARYRKGVSDMEAAIKDGKSSPSNEWDFKTKAANWLDSTDLKATFNDGYLPYTDYKKHSLDVLKSLTKDETITDDAFGYDEKGNIVIYDAVVRKKLAGKSPEQIQQALMAVLTPADMKQMEIDGRYAYSNLKPEEFISSINNDYNNQKASYSEKIKSLETAKSKTKSPEVISQIDDSISEINKTLGKIEREYKTVSKLAMSSDPESAKAMLHTYNFMNGFGSAFSYTETSQTYETSPYATAERWREDRKWDQTKFWAGYEQTERQMAAAAEERRLKRESEGGDTGWGAFPTPVNKDDVPEVTIEKLNSAIENGRIEIDNNDYEFLNRHKKDKAWLDEMEESRKNGTLTNPEIKRYLTNRAEKIREIESNIALKTEVGNLADEKFRELDNKLSVDSNLGLNINGSQVIYTPEEIADFNITFEKYKVIQSHVGAPSAKILYSYDDDRAKRELSPKYLRLYDIYQKAEIKAKLTDEEKSIMGRSSEYKKLYGEELKKKAEFVGEELKNRLTRHQGAGHTIDASKPADKQYLQGMLQRVANLAEAPEGIANSPKFDIDILRKAVANPSVATLEVVEGTEFQPSMYTMTVTEKDGEQTSFRLTPEQKTYVFGNRFEATPEVRAIRRYQDQIRKTGGYTTAKDGEAITNKNNAYLDRELDFPAIKIFGVSGNIVEDRGSYLLKLNIYDPAKNKWVENISFPRDYMTEEQVAIALTGLNDSEIYKMLYSKYPTEAELEDIQKLQNDPLNAGK